MSAKSNYFKLGLFIISAVVLAIVGLMALGAGQLFENRIIVETYVDQSVQGVDVGTKVKYRGVAIGNIRRVDFTRNEYPPTGSQSNWPSYVLPEMELHRLPYGTAGDQLGARLDEEARRGLRARLTPQGVTGTYYVELDYVSPSRFPALPLEWKPHHLYIPSANSAFAAIVSSAEDVFSHLQNIDFERIANNLEKLVLTLNRKIDSLPVQQLGTNAVELLAELRVTNQRLQTVLATPDIENVIRDASGAATALRRFAESPDLTNSVARLQRVLMRADQLLAGKDDEIQATLINLRSLSENLRAVSESVRRYPGGVLFDKPPAPEK